MNSHVSIILLKQLSLFDHSCFIDFPHMLPPTPWINVKQILGLYYFIKNMPTHVSKTWGFFLKYKHNATLSIPKINNDVNIIKCLVSV